MATKRTTHLGNGYGFGLSITPLLMYDPQTYPYFLVKEQGSFSILDPLSNLMSEIISDPKNYTPDNKATTSSYHLVRDERVVFMPNICNVFFTSSYENGHYYMKQYQINEKFLQSLYRNINANSSAREED